MQAGFVGREFCSDRLRSFNHPKVEDFSLYKQFIHIAYSLAKSLSVVARIARNDAVYKCRVNSTSFSEPSLEVFTQVP